MQEVRNRWIALEGLTQCRKMVQLSVEVCSRLHNVPLYRALRVDASVGFVIASCTLNEENQLRTLSKNEINQILLQGRDLSEGEVTSILDEFETQQPEIYQAIFAELSDGIAEVNQEMANLFLDLCFDIIWLYRKAFGKPPAINKREEWLTNSLSLLDAELKSLCEYRPMHDSIRTNLQRRFVKRSRASGVQMSLLEHLDREVEKYASFKKERQSAIQVTNNLLFVIVRLMDELYTKTNS